MDEIFRQNNEGNVPDWLKGFLEEFRLDKKNMINNGLQFQHEFNKLLKIELRTSNDFSKTHEKQFKRTIRRYLTQFQYKILQLFIKQILKNKNHPISVISNLFKKHFDNSYRNYIQPSGKNDKGEIKRLVTIYNSKSEALKNDYIKK